MTTFEYPGFEFQQRADGSGPPFFIFHAPVGEIDKWADVERLSPEEPRRVQREPVKSRINSIRRFFERETKNTIPTALVIALRDVEVKGDGSGHKRLSITASEHKKPGLIIDGQHRLRGMQAVGSATRVAIVAILEPDMLEIAFQFLVINNKAAKVPRDHLRALALNYAEDELRTRLESARLSLDENVGSVGILDEDEESPFRGMIAWPNNPQAQRVVVPSAIESIAGYARSLGIKELEEADGLNAFLMAMWRRVKAEWAEIFNGESHLLEKVGLVCLTQFVTDTLKTWSVSPRIDIDFGDPAAIESWTGDVLECLEPKFFAATWSSTSYDTRAGRDQIMVALRTITQNVAGGDPWYDDVHVVDTAWLDEHRQGASPRPPDVR